jgi:hypothetical protein
MSKSYVYVIGTGCDQAPIKIGFSADPHKRAASLSTGAMNRLTVLFARETEHPRQVEKRVHTALKGKRIKGEWFAVDKDAAKVAIMEATAHFQSLERTARPMSDREFSRLLRRIRATKATIRGEKESASCPWPWPTITASGIDLSSGHFDGVFR